MDYEKKYKEAFERAKANYESSKTMGFIAIADTIMDIFPELRESEDERIRKWLLGEMKIHYDFESPNLNPMVEKAIAYLEKQKEIPMPNSTELIEMWDKEEAMLKEKDFRGDEWRLAYNAFMDGFARGTCVKFEKQKEQKDYHKLYDDIANSEWFKKAYVGKSLGADDEQKEQKPVEWSEEDKNTYKWVYNLFERSNDKWFECVFAGCHPKVKRESVLAWLKSLRPSWKPSEHQMTILKAVKDYVGVGSGYWGEALGSLIEDLEKLM